MREPHEILFTDERPTFELLPEEQYPRFASSLLPEWRTVTVTWRCGHKEEQDSSSTEESQERLKEGTLFRCTGCWVSDLMERKRREA